MTIHAHAAGQSDNVGQTRSSAASPLPDGWRWAKLRHVCEAVRGVTFRSGDAIPQQADGHIACLTTSAVQHEVAWSTRRYVPITAIAQPGQLLRSGDLLVSTANSKALVGKACLVTSLPEPATFGAFVTVLRPVSGMLPVFLAYLFLRKETLDFCYFTSSNTTGISNLRVSDLLELHVPLPPLPEQKRIAALLTEQLAAVDRARAAAEAQLQAAQSLPAAFLREVFDSPEARRWPMVQLGHIAALGPDNGIFRRRCDYGNGVPIVNVSDLYTSLEADLAAAERVRVTPRELAKYSVAPGDLFFCRSSLKREGIGWCCYLKHLGEPAVFECHVMRIRLDAARAIPEYVALYWRLGTVRQQVIRAARTATMTTMNQGDLARVPVPLPSLTEQRRVSARLNSQLHGQAQTVRAVADRLASLSELPRVFLRAAFNGEL